MKAKKVKDTTKLSEWYSTDSGLDVYDMKRLHGDDMNKEKIDNQVIDNPEEELSGDEIQGVIPSHNDIHFTPELLASYFNQILEVIVPEDPKLALNVFHALIQEHPYIKTERKIGFHGGNAFEPVVREFLEELKKFLR